MKEFEEDDHDDEDDDDMDELPYYKILNQESLDAAHLDLTEYNLNIELLKLVFAHCQDATPEQVGKIIAYYKMFYFSLNNFKEGENNAQL